MPPLSQYQASRLLELVRSNRALVDGADHVDQDLWARAQPPLRGLAFSDRREARVNLAGGHLCAVPTAMPDITSPSPPASPSQSAVSSLDEYIPPIVTLNEISSPIPLQDTNRGSLSPFPPNQPLTMPRVESTNSRTSKISSAPSFGKLPDPLSSGSIHVEPSQAPPNRSAESSTGLSLSRIVRSTPEYEEFGNEALITHVFDDLDDDYELDNETPSTLFQDIGASVSESKSILRTRSLSSVRTTTPHHNHHFDNPEAECNPFHINKENPVKNISNRTAPGDGDIEVDRKLDHEPRFDSITDSILHDEPTTQDSLPSLQQNHSFPIETNRLLTISQHSSSASGLPLQGSSHEGSGPPSTPIPPPPPIYSTNSPSDDDLSPIIPNAYSTCFATDSFPDGLPLPPVTPPLAPSAYDEFDSFSNGMGALHLRDNDPPSQSDDSSPVTDFAMASHSHVTDNRSMRPVSMISSHVKKTSHRTNNSRSFVSTSDYFSRSEYTGFSDYSRRVDSSVEVETSDEDELREHEAFDDELREAEMSGSALERIGSLHDTSVRRGPPTSTVAILNRT